MLENHPYYYDLFRVAEAGRSAEARFLLHYALRRSPVLDVGAGTGRLAVPLAEHGIPVVCVEPSAGLSGVLLSRLGARADLDRLLTIRSGDLRQLDLGRTFPLVHASRTMLMLTADSDRKAALAGLRRHVAAGGLLIADFALLGSMQEGPLVPVAQRTIGETTYRWRTARERVDEALWRTTWVFDAERAGEVREDVRETYLVRLDAPGQVTTDLEAAGFAVTERYADFAWSEVREDSPPGTLVVVATHR